MIRTLCYGLDFRAVSVLVSISVQLENEIVEVVADRQCNET
jgi:hypothetical protein